MRELEFTKKGKKYRVTGIPDDAKVTFQAINPHQPASPGSCALRIYKGTNQLACFTGIDDFRDLTIECSEHVIPQTPKRDWIDMPQTSISSNPLQGWRI